MLAPVKTTASGGGADWPRFALALAFNLVPIAGVIYWGWSGFELIFLYWIENVVIGVRTFLAIALSGRFHGYRAAMALALFFSVHYSIFCGVHGAFIFALFGGVAEGEAVNVSGALQSIWFAAAAITLWQAALLAMHVASGDRSTPMAIMASPYPRIVVLHVTIMAGGLLLLALGWPHAGVLVLALVKTAMDAAIALSGWRFGGDDAKAQVTPPASRPHP